MPQQQDAKLANPLIKLVQFLLIEPDRSHIICSKNRMCLDQCTQDEMTGI